MIKVTVLTINMIRKVRITITVTEKKTPTTAITEKNNNNNNNDNNVATQVTIKKFNKSLI